VTQDSLNGELINTELCEIRSESAAERLTCPTSPETYSETLSRINE